MFYFSRADKPDGKIALILKNLLDYLIEKEQAQPESKAEQRADGRAAIDEPAKQKGDDDG